MTNQTSSLNALSVAVLAGGPSAEAEVSRHSAKQIQLALERADYSTQVFELDKHCVSALLALSPDVVFPALHGPPGEDGTVQGMLEMLQLPYVGSDVHGSAMAMDKATAKRIFQRHSLPISEDYVVTPGQDIVAACSKIKQQLGSALAIKPLNQGSAIGVQLLRDDGDLAQALNQAHQFGSCLVEPFIQGREMTVGVLQLGSELLMHPVIEIQTPKDQWYDFEHRYAVGKSEHFIPAKISPALAEQLQSVAYDAHLALGLRDLSRADFIVTDDDQVYLLEVNALPGMTPTSLYPEGAAAIGYSFEQLVHALVQNAYRRRAT